MSDKFQDKYRITSTRLQNWDYAWDAAYFITICTKNREHYYGEVKSGKMVLSELGEIVEKEWLKTFDMRPDMNLTPDVFVVMPNHFHAIVIIGKNKYNSGGNYGRDAMHCVSTMGCISTKDIGDAKHCVSTNKFGPQSKNLASIIRGFKIGVTTNARKIHADFQWQDRFYDHIIRNDTSHEKIRNYIINNPLNWNKDKFY